MFERLYAGVGASCGLDQANRAYCWGRNSGGQLGDSSLTQSSVPVAVAGGIRFDSLSVGDTYACGLTNGAAYCWGQNYLGRLGLGSGAPQRVIVPTPVVGGHTFTSIHAGTLHTCGLTESGQAYCWGRNVYGQLGTGDDTNSSEPVPVVQ